MSARRTTTPHMPAIAHVIEDGEYHAGGGAALYATTEAGFLGLGEAKRIRFSIDLPSTRGRHTRAEIQVTLDGLARVLAELHDGAILDILAQRLAAETRRAVDDQVAAIEAEALVSAEIVAATAGRMSP